MILKVASTFSRLSLDFFGLHIHQDYRLLLNLRLSRSEQCCSISSTYCLFFGPRASYPYFSLPKAPKAASISGYAVFDMGSAGKAISRNGHINAPKAVVAYTMPAILAGSSCATIRRLWILAPIKSDHGVNSRKTVKKLRPFTLVPFKDDGARVLGWNNQRIQG